MGFLLVACAAMGQAGPGSRYLVLPVDFEVVNGEYKNAMLYVRRGDETVASIQGKNLLKVRLEYNTEYRLDFKSEGYITKSIRINTNVPDERRIMGFDPYKIGVRLFKQYEGVNIVIYNQPVAYIRYLPELDEFSYDTDYTKSILSVLKETENALEDKARQERDSLKIIKAHKREYPRTVQVGDTLSVAGVEVAALQSRETGTSNQTLPQASDNSGGLSGDSPSKSGNKLRETLQQAMGGGQSFSLSQVAGMGEDNKPMWRPQEGDEYYMPEFIPHEGADRQPVSNPEPQTIERNEERIVEANRVITIYRIKRGQETREFRRVSTAWGANFYFMGQNKPISEHLFCVFTGE